MIKKLSRKGKDLLAYLAGWVNQSKKLKKSKRKNRGK